MWKAPGGGFTAGGGTWEPGKRPSSATDQVSGPPGLPGRLSGKESTCQAGDVGSIPGLERFPWRRKWQPTPVFLPGEFHGQRSRAGPSPWGHKESDMTE